MKYPEFVFLSELVFGYSWKAELHEKFIFFYDIIQLLSTFSYH